MAKGSGNTRSYSPSILNQQSLNKEGLITMNEEIAFEASERLKKIVKDRELYGYSRDSKSFKFGTLPDTYAKIFEEKTGIEIVSKDMYTGQSSLFHHRGGQKSDRGKETSIEDIIEMPKKIMEMDAYISRDAIVFTDYKNKYIMKPNQKIKTEEGKIIVTNHVSSSRVIDSNEFKKGREYEKITS